MQIILSDTFWFMIIPFQYHFKPAHIIQSPMKASSYVTMAFFVLIYSQICYSFTKGETVLFLIPHILFIIFYTSAFAGTSESCMHSMLATRSLWYQLCVLSRYLVHTWLFLPCQVGKLFVTVLLNILFRFHLSSSWCPVILSPRNGQ